MVKRIRVWTITALIVGSLAACASRRPPSEPIPSVAETASTPAQGGIIEQARSRWVPVTWSELPGFDADALHDAWNAWLRSCERPGPVFGPVCGEVRQLSIGSSEEQRAWMQARLQPYRVEAPGGGTQGLLTGYYEPMFEASRLPRQGFAVPLYRPPAGLAAGRAWFSRQQIDTLPQAQAALRGQEIA
ncbi:MAG: MltA domain-containing protein, partial [Hylemonella sp.]